MSAIYPVSNWPPGARYPRVVIDSNEFVALLSYGRRHYEVFVSYPDGPIARLRRPGNPHTLVDALKETWEIALGPTHDDFTVVEAAAESPTLAELDTLAEYVP